MAGMDHSQRAGMGMAGIGHGPTSGMQDVGHGREQMQDVDAATPDASAFDAAADRFHAALAAAVRDAGLT